MRFWEYAQDGVSERAGVPASPFDCTLEQAQDWCNFVVLRPDWLPSDCRIAKITVRPETSHHPSSLRILIEGERRSMRLKQFYLDWWIPTSSDANLTAPGRTFVAAGIVGCLGRDYKGREAACIHRLGALLELSVADGHFSDREITAFCDNLQPQFPEAVEQLAALPFAKLSYYSRKGPSLGPWNYDLLSGCRWSSERTSLRQFDPSQVYFPRMLPDSFIFDSVGTRRDPATRHWEYQLLFRHQGNLTDNVWLRAVGEETERILWISPGLDRRMGVRLDPVQLPRRRVSVGSTSSPYGEKIAQWTENGIAFEVHARASLHLGADSFLSFLDSLSRE